MHLVPSDFVNNNASIQQDTLKLSLLPRQGNLNQPKSPKHNITTDIRGSINYKPLNFQTLATDTMLFLHSMYFDVRRSSMVTWLVLDIYHRPGL